MKCRKAPLVIVLFIACATSSRRSEIGAFDPCPMVKAVLKEVIHPADDDVHLRTACVQEHASNAGTTWVDARIFDKAGKQVLPDECPLNGYQIRFGKPDEPKPLGDGVLIVSISYDGNGQSRFFAQIEAPDWHVRRPNVYTPSHCGSVTERMLSVLEGAKPRLFDNSSIELDPELPSFTESAPLPAPTLQLTEASHAINRICEHVESYRSILPEINRAWAPFLHAGSNAEEAQVATEASTCLSSLFEIKEALLSAWDPFVRTVRAQQDESLHTTTKSPGSELITNAPTPVRSRSSKRRDPVCIRELKRRMAANGLVRNRDVREAFDLDAQAAYSQVVQLKHARILEVRGKPPTSYYVAGPAFEKWGNVPIHDAENTSEILLP